MTRVTRAIGDEVEACYARVLRALMGYARRHDLAEDALQDAVERALATGTEIRQMDAWLYGVAVRRLRRRAWRIRLERPLTLLVSTIAPPSVDRLIVLELLDVLTERQRAFVLGRYYLDLSYAKLAETLDVSTGTATATVTQALARMREADRRARSPKGAES